MDIGLHPTYLNICSSYESVGNEGGLLELHAARQGLCNPDGGKARRPIRRIEIPLQDMLPSRLWVGLRQG
jgi:hypothetical protein